MYIKKMLGYVLAKSEENTHRKNSNDMAQGPASQGATYYQYLCENGACDECTQLDGRVFLVSEAQEGINFPPLHPNCKCEVQSYFGADAIILAERVYGIHDNPGGLSMDDWIFYGLTGSRFEPNPALTYSNEDFGKSIDGNTPLRQNDPALKDMHIVDRIARILYEEHTTSDLCQAGLAWVILNRLLSDEQGFPDDLQSLITGREQFEVFYEPMKRSGRDAALRPDVESDGWKNALLLAKQLVSVACNPNLTAKQKRNAFEAWTPNPFKLEVGDEVQGKGGNLDPYNVKYWYGGFGWSGEKEEQVEGFISLGYSNGLFNAFYEEYTVFN